ncbi:MULTISPECIES: PTS sugar transporter subunit IIC [unclassified Lactobacillus]|uniref:PTS sugar transporter subunit IIC n=1 Tax=unclassified Lactobacillus TaxID=2620435 RepID=UPI002269C759|nr:MULTISPECIES: PTS sugar transporter subunit IIC [unclassified Lactobacillus]MCX8721371.1 PTS sugar transporter subunit IIC [Lactobacillus sp. B4010]MCX8732982.1 PTS sugar transporter subunit IIC [Lactobacillus sp. B4015]MCX8735678.1 PTS sugar transporter subunit IIC [Lactobacillus sp. B4012]
MAGTIENEKITVKTFLNNILAGTATGIIVGLIPNAVVSAILKLFGANPVTTGINQALLIFQCATPLLIGALIAIQFKMVPLDVAIVGAAACVGSGVTKFVPQMVNPATKAQGVFVSAGTGDLINTMITSGLAVGLLLLVGDHFGSVKIIAAPILIGGGAGWIGMLILPYVSKITTWLGTLINSFTTLQPVLMCILIACMFAILIISPISTVAIGMAIQLNGLSAGAAAMGVAATTLVLVVHSWRTNKSGVTLAIALGAMKMMMPNLFRHPIILLPSIITAIVTAIPVALLGVSGTPASAGFGLVGLVGPIASLDAGKASISIFVALLVWIVIPVVVALICRFVFEKVFHVYDEKVVFAYLGE